MLSTNNMKNLKKSIFGLAALVVAFGLVVSVSAFKGTANGEKRALVYFKYNGSTFNEANYRNIENWEHITDPEAPSCAGSSDICVLSVDDADLTAPGTMEEKLDDFFNSELAAPNEVNSYVTDANNIVSKQN